MQTPDELKAATATKMNALWQKLAGIVLPLTFRWRDEREYEDFADYIKVVKAAVNKEQGVMFVSMTKRFAITVTLDIRPGVSFEMKFGGKAGWARIA